MLSLLLISFPKILISSEGVLISSLEENLGAIRIIKAFDASNFISSSFPDYSNLIILAIGGLSIFTSIISSVAQFLKVSQLSESHRISYLSWERFHSKIKFQLNKRRSSRDCLKDFISMVVPEYQRLKEISATIPKHICDDVKKNKKNLKNMHIPYIFYVNGLIVIN